MESEIEGGSAFSSPLYFLDFCVVSGSWSQFVATILLSAGRVAVGGAASSSSLQPVPARLSQSRPVRDKSGRHRNVVKSGAVGGTSGRDKLGCSVVGSLDSECTCSRVHVNVTYSGIEVTMATPSFFPRNATLQRRTLVPGVLRQPV